MCEVSDTVVKIQTEVFWIVMLHSVVVGYQCFRWREKRQHSPPKHWYPTTTLHGITTQKTWTWMWCKITFHTP